MRTLNIDIETYSEVDLKKSGMYKYAEKIEILLFAWSFDGDPDPIVKDFTKFTVSRSAKLPRPVYEALTDPTVKKKAFNAPFEIACISSYFDIELDPAQWECTMMRSAMAGLPLSLDQSSKALNLEIKKDNAGMALIRYFCMPCKPTATNGERLRNHPKDAPEKWEAFKNYCRQDVVTEMAVGAALSFMPIPINEKLLWDLDQRINSTGVRVDMRLVENAIIMDHGYREKLIAQAIKLTGVDKPTSVAQIKKWLEIEEDIQITSLAKEHIPALVKKLQTGKAKKVLNIRQELSKTSVRKYTTIRVCVCRDGRLKGLLQFYGANRTGRWAGRLVQVHNLPKGEYHGQLLDDIRKLALERDSQMLEMVFGSVPDTLSQIIRTSFIAAMGKRFIISDFSAIEARIISWLADEKWRLEVFATHGKIYEASASQMFNVPLEAVTKTSNYRAKGKIAELALGYQGGVNALLRMEATDKDIQKGTRKPIPEDELQPIVDAWRLANPQIKNLWYAMGRAAVQAVKTGQKVTADKGIYFVMRRGFLMMYLPSGRALCYANAKVMDGKYGEVVTYMGLNQETKQWQRQQTYGGKLVENAVQAIARDCLANGLLNLDEAGYSIVFHVHDEIICEEFIGDKSLETMINLMIKPAHWYQGLNLAADGFESPYYKKD